MLKKFFSILLVVTMVLNSIQINIYANINGNEVVEDSEEINSSIDFSEDNNLLNNNDKLISSLSSEFLTINFDFLPKEALIGDEVESVITFHRQNNTINYTNINFNINNSWQLPSVFKSIGSNNPGTPLNFNTIKDVVSASYGFVLEDVEEIRVEQSQQYNLNGNYSYGLDAAPYYTSGNTSNAEINVKRGQIRVKVIDESGANITEYSSINLNNHQNSMSYKDGEYIFDPVPTGNYILELSGLPNGYYIEDGEEATELTVNYNNNEITHVFQVKGKMDAPIRILEIEPADSFKLTNQSGKILTGIETTSTVINGTSYLVEIHHMTMAEFIAKTTKINGYYDAIVIGNWIDWSSSVNNTTLFNQYYYLENDITDRKSEEIKQYIETGQLVYMDSQLKSKSDLKIGKNFATNGAWDIHKENFNGGYTLNDNQNSLTIVDIVEDYLNRDEIFQRPNFSVEVSEGDSLSTEFGNRETRKMNFKLNTDLASTDGIKINLYLDINGDGLFKEEERVSLDKISFYEKDETIHFELDYDFYKDFPEFVGLLDWQIELEKDTTEEYPNAIVSYQQGNILFRRLGDKRVINVLQISPYEIGNIDNNLGGNLNLLQHQEFQDLLDVDEVQDYTINIDVISYQEFYGEQYSQFENSEDLKDSKYDMVIVGFSDNYQLNMFKDNENAIQQIREFIESGQSIMFTHDTFYNSYTQDIVTPSYGSGFALTKAFRDIIGQSRYWDPNNSSALDIDGDLIPHDNDQSSYITSYNPGFTTLRRNDSNMSQSEATSVYQINQSLITSYPFQLGESISIRKTHGQYFQLNLEDEDVVPWFTLENSLLRPNINRYDAMNSYYTYSKGNITFSGTGENTRDSNGYPESELKLFVNTIVKAERGANHAPVIESNLFDNRDNLIYKDVKEFDFNVTVKDIDNDLMNVSIDLYLEDPRINQEAITNPLLSQSNVSSGEAFNLKIANKNQVMYLKVTAEDEHGASTTKIYVVVPSDNVVSYTVTGNKGLVGEVLELNIQFDLSNITAVIFQMDENNTSGIQFLDENFASKKEVNLTNSELRYQVNGTREVDGYLTGSIIYSDGTSQNIKIPISILEPEIIVKLDFIEDVEVQNISVTLSKGEVLETKEITESVKFKDKLTVGNGYSLTINNLPEGIAVIKIDIKDVKNNENSSEINLRYNSPIYECTLTIGGELTLESTLEHGLFLGLNHNPILDIDEDLSEDLLKTFSLNSVVALGAKIEAGKDNMVVSFTKDSNGTVIGTPVVVRIDSDLNEKSNCIKSMNDNFVCKLGNKGTYVVTYNYKLSIESLSSDFYIFRNTMSLIDSEYLKIARIKVSRNSNLPNLF